MNALYILAALLPACCLGAQTTYDPAQIAHSMFIDADSDGDGIMHRTELVAVFSRYDSNHDGRVSRHEYTVYQESHDPELVPLAHFLYDTYDVDNDHHLDQHDYENFYKLMDNDGDDSVSEAEFRAYWEVLLASASHLHPIGK